MSCSKAQYSTASETPQSQCKQSTTEGSITIYPLIPIHLLQNTIVNIAQKTWMYACKVKHMA